MRKKINGVNKDEGGGWEKLVLVEGRRAIIKIYYMENIFSFLSILLNSTIELVLT